MSQQTLIKFKNQVIEKSQDELKQFLNNSEKEFELIFTDTKLTGIINVKQDKAVTTDKIRMVAGHVARAFSKRKVTKAMLNEADLIEEFKKLDKSQVITAFVEGWELGLYTYTKYKSKANDVKTELHIESAEDITSLIEAGKNRAAAVMFSRDLMNDAPQDLTPDTFPERLKEEFTSTDIDVTIHNQDKLKEMEMNGILAVNRGSTHEPAFVELRYEGDTSKPLTALVGKGVTFDTGGISLKTGRHLSDMRMDMGGAAAVAGAMKLLAESKAKVNVVALIQIVENMPDSHSFLPGEVITYKTGQTVQVGNTDAEGRLILADGLIRAGELEAEYIVDIATLTGAIHAALGSKLGGVFGDEELAEDMKKLGDENGDFVWPMPLVDAYESYLKSDYADFNNISTKGEAGAITAALFLRKFVPENAQWLHVDMAGVMESTEAGYYNNGGTGFGARLLADFAKHISEK